MSANLSPGPWELRMTHVSRHEGEEHVVEVERFIRDAHGRQLATIGNGKLSPAAADLLLPDARAMAAAADLLAAARQARHVMNAALGATRLEIRDAIDGLTAALEKAGAA